MHKTVGLLMLAFSAALAAQTLESSFVGRVISCESGYTLFRTDSGEIVRLTSSVDCDYYLRYRQWKVFRTVSGGAHPDHVTGIEPMLERWEYNEGVPAPVKKRFRFQFKSLFLGSWRN